MVKQNGGTSREKKQFFSLDDVGYARFFLSINKDATSLHGNPFLLWKDSGGIL
jgi:hypothetical protein